MTKMRLIEAIFQPTNQSLHTLIFGKSGSGKSYFNIHLLKAAISDRISFPKNHRFIIIDPKTQPGDYDQISTPLDGLNPKEIAESISENRVTLIWPDYDNVVEIVEYIIEILFSFADAVSDFSATFILDEAGELITHTTMPKNIGKLAVQGRAKKIKGVFLNQRPILNRKLDSQVESLILFDMIDIDSDNLMKRWGLNYDKWVPKIQEEKHSFLLVHFVNNIEQIFDPIKLI